MKQNDDKSVFTEKIWIKRHCSDKIINYTLSVLLPTNNYTNINMNLSAKISFIVC